MVEFKFVTNVNELLSSLEKKKEYIIRRIQTGLYHGMRHFERDIISMYYSGRKGSVGLNTISGNLRRSWLVQKYSKGLDFSVRLANKMVYGPTHEFGDVREIFGGPMIGHFQKRTDVTGKFKKSGFDYLNKAVLEALSYYKKAG